MSDVKLRWLSLGSVTDPCEHGNEASGSTKGGEFLDCLSNYQVINLLHIQYPRRVSFCLLKESEYTDEISKHSRNLKPANK